jgi:NAD(P)-dependent dehydrogenase (short-subunit alcohol dehydrogenase family)
VLSEPALSLNAGFVLHGLSQPWPVGSPHHFRKRNDAMSSEQKQTLPPQVQDQQPGYETEMNPRPAYEPRYPGSDRLKGKVALITGGDSGIGRATAVLFAREGADLVILYLNEGEDAQETKRLIEREGRSCLTIAGDIGDPNFCRAAVDQAIQRFGKLDVLVNNAAEQHPKSDIAEITPDQIDRTFRTNIFGYFYMVQAAMPHLKNGSAIINTTSVTAYRGSGDLLDYSATKGAIVALTRSLAQKLASEGIRVNGVAPGPIWTPLIPSTFPAEKVKQFGANTPMQRPGQPNEVAPSYLFLACEDSSYITGSVLHPNGGDPTEA